MLKPIIYPYHMASNAAGQLARALDTRRVYASGTYRNHHNHLVVNWGNSATPSWNLPTTKWLNSPRHVRRAANKLQTMKTLHNADIPVPKFLEAPSEAQILTALQSCDIYLRHKLTGHSGQGIQVLRRGEGEQEFECPPLATWSLGRRKEFRVHVFLDDTIHIQQKRRLSGQECDWSIRSHDNGWIYSIENVDSTIEQALADCVRAVSALDLQFGAVDIAITDNTDRTTTGANHAILEVNTAPGFDGSTVYKYSSIITNLSQVGF